MPVKRISRYLSNIKAIYLKLFTQSKRGKDSNAMMIPRKDVRAYYTKSKTTLEETRAKMNQARF